jgi:hypothetical protein
MGFNRMDHFKFLTSLLVLGAFVGCTHQEINNSPCATLNATIQIKPAAKLSLMFGSDAIKAAVEAVSRQIIPPGNTSLSGLTSSGTDAALRTAKANGKNPTANDISALETYLRDDVVPAIKQNPNCSFTVASSGRPYVGLNQIFMRKIGDKQFPIIGIINTGTAEANAHIEIRQILDGKEYSNNSANTIIGPNQSRSISFREANLPIPDIESGKTVLTIAVDISYPLESGASPFLHQEAWRYDHTSKDFYSLLLK